MQTIRIIISGNDGKAQIVKISDSPKFRFKKSIHTLLRSMSKAMLAKALDIPARKEDGNDV